MQNAVAMAAWRDAFIDWARRQEARSIHLDLASGAVTEGAIYALTRGFYCRGLAGVQLFDAARAKDPHIHCTITADDQKVKLIIRYDPRNLVTTSGWNALLGMSYLTVFFRITHVNSDRIEASALAIGQLTTVIDGTDTGFPPSSEVGFEQVDEFGISSRRPPSSLDRVLALSEDQVKQKFARLLKESYVPKDHGGELSDLIAPITVDGRRYRAAFLLKGPGNGVGPMTFKKLGKNGDQLVRLFKEDADVYVIQHCHRVTPAVVDTARAFAMQIGRPRRYMIIDGYATHQILEGAGELG